MSEGWATVTALEWTAPLYWRNDGPVGRYSPSKVGSKSIPPNPCAMSVFTKPTLCALGRKRLPTSRMGKTAAVEHGHALSLL